VADGLAGVAGRATPAVPGGKAGEAMELQIDSSGGNKRKYALTEIKADIANTRLYVRRSPPPPPPMGGGTSTQPSLTGGNQHPPHPSPKPNPKAREAQYGDQDNEDKQGNYSTHH
jgi:hypothetical protein